MKLHLLGFYIVTSSLCYQPIFAQCSRATMVANYNAVYLTSNVTATDLAWTGNTTGCLAGIVSAASQTKTFNRLNYYRTLCGLSPITYDNQYDAKCQEAALLMRANNALNHTPPTTWTCYTANGATGAGNSNIALGAHSTTAVDLYMNDGGTGNEPVGHRRWILYPIASKFGHGATSNSDVLWVFGTNANPQNTTFVAYPSAGYFPAPLVPSSARWSFSKNGAIFSSASIVMTDNTGANVPTNVVSIATGYGMNTIVFQPASVITNSPIDLTYTVNINNVLVNGVAQNFSYKVIIAQPTHPPTCPTGKVWSESNCQCQSLTAVSNPVEILFFKGYTEGRANILLWSTTKERHVDRYVIERSANSVNEFIEIGSVEASQNSVVERHYNLIDHHPLPNSYYRLKIVDLDGKVVFSDMVALEERKQNGIFIVYPNPNTGKFTLKLNDKNATNCRVMNALGQVIKQVFLETNETSLDLVGAKPGIYWVEVKANDLLWFQKIQVN